ncbi:putative AAA family ATPase [Pestalotiopsis sp. NC0098]|nr:putative AAA family ATPase [Pestalotiopsis sp. NC0098]
MPPNKRKRDILDFDPNKSDSDDENFQPDADRPTRSRKKSRPAKSGKGPSRVRRNKYRGSDIEDDDEESESGGEESFDEPEEDEEEEEEEMPVNENTGRRMRKAAVKAATYRESSDDSAASGSSSDDKDDLPRRNPNKNSPRPSKIVVLQVRKTRAGSAKVASTMTRRTTRAQTADDDEELVELSNSGKHVMPARGSRSISPEAASRMTRATRGGKGVMRSPPPPIEEATQESSPRKGDTENGERSQSSNGELKAPEVESLSDDDAAESAVKDEDHPMETVEPEEADDEDDEEVPVTRRTRGNRPTVADDAEDEPAEEEPAEEEPMNTRSRRLTRKSRSKKSLQEPSSDFEPGNDSGDDNESVPDKAQTAADDGNETTPSRGRKNTRGRGRSAKASHRDSGDEEVELDRDEMAEELEDLRGSSNSRRPRRRRQRSPSIRAESVRGKRKRNLVNYSIMPPRDAAEDEEQVPAPSPARRGRRGGAAGWDRTLHTIAGPFGGVNISGPGALFSGPWGTGATATGGVDSDSSDDEMGGRSGLAGPGGDVGKTPTSAVPPGFLGGPGLNVDGGAAALTAAPNVGKVKNQKAYADADPLGVDLNVDFTKVGGLEGHIDQLKEMVQLPLLYPELFMKFHVTPPRGVLFHGPPGTGKTLLARALANSVGIGGKKITFYMRKGADALSKWVGEAEKQLRLLFEEARRTQPSIIFFDEIDGLAPVRSSKQEQIHASIVSTLLALMDGMDGRGQVIVIGATNRPDNIDPALRRPGRFDREFYFPLPDVDARKAIIDIHTKDWGVSDDFKRSLARDAKGYGGADLRAMCTEAAMNAIQRTYPQIYASKDKLIVDPDKIDIQMTDFVLSKKKIVPSSERAATSGAASLPKPVEPLLHDQLHSIQAILEDILPRKKKVTALEEAMFEPYDDEDFGFAREALNEEFERSRVFRPRLLICGQPGMGHSYLAAAVLHYLEGVHVQNFDLPTIFGDSRSPEQVLVGLFTEVRRHKPSVIFIPNVDTWYTTLEGPALTAFLSMLRSIPPTDPILVLGTSETDVQHLPGDLKRDLFGFSRKNSTEIAPPTKDNRRKFFSMIISNIRRFPREFPDPANRKKRVLEQLEVAPPPPPKVLTKEEEKAEWLKYRQLLNYLKVHIQPIMEQINRKYKIFRQAPIPHSHYQYLFDEQDPNYVLPDVEGAIDRPYVIAKDKDGVQGLRETATGKFFYNIDVQTIEERLANGFYTKPSEFLRDIRALEKDAKASGDRLRILRASELLTNVEVDVSDIEKVRLPGVPWDELYEAEKRRRAAKAEKARKKTAMQSLVDGATTSGTGTDGQGVETPKLHTTTARFQVMSPLPSALGASSASQNHTNGTSVPSGAVSDDVQMTDVETQLDFDGSPMHPPSQWPKMPPRALNLSTRATTGGTTQLSQVSAVQSLPAGVSPSALANDASTTKTSDPSNRSSNWSTQVTNGVPHEQSSPEQLPDTQPYQSQTTSSDEQWPHSQAHGIARGVIQAPGYSASSRNNTSMNAARSSNAASVANLLNDPLPEDQSQSQRHSGGSSASQQQVELDEASGAIFLTQLTARTSGCTIEQLEQLTREMMSEIWRTKGEHNRMKVLDAVTRVFNESINDIETIQNVYQSSQ